MGRSFFFLSKKKHIIRENKLLGLCIVQERPSFLSLLKERSFLHTSEIDIWFISIYTKLKPISCWRLSPHCFLASKKTLITSSDTCFQLSYLRFKLIYLIIFIFRIFYFQVAPTIFCIFDSYRSMKFDYQN